MGLYREVRLYDKYPESARYFFKIQRILDSRLELFFDLNFRKLDRPCPFEVLLVRAEASAEVMIKVMEHPTFSQASQTLITHPMPQSHTPSPPELDTIFCAG